MLFFRLPILYLILSFLSSNSILAQTIYSTNNIPLTNFQPPLQINPPALSGSFGELRSNHFHSGIDYRTNQRTGFPVYAAEDGYISRLRVQNSGFGLALYINHPNGITTVYAHLLRYNPKIEQIVKQIQYQKQSYEIDEFPKSDLIIVRKGELIAYSGNSGSSGGPHLHFETRDTKTEEIINPQLLGIQIPDHTPPTIQAFYVYHLNGKPFNEYTPKQYYQIAGSNGNYTINKVKTIHLNGEVGFGIVTNDRHDGASGNNGVYAIELKVDNQIVYTSTFERFAFANSRAINSHIDYPTFLKTNQRIQKSFVEPGNPLKLYHNLVNQGKLNFNDGKLHQVLYTISDAKGNKSTLNFNIQSDSKPEINFPKQPDGILFKYQNLNEFANDEIKIIIPKGNLYDDLNFIYHKNTRKNSQYLSDTYHIHNKYTPLHQGFDIWIKTDSTSHIYKDKLVIVNEKGISQGGIFDNGWLKANTRTFGSFRISIDTIAPRINPINISNVKDMSQVSKIIFKINDNLSGIKSFNGYIDGKWILMEFDTKTATLWHSFDERTIKGKHTFELIVSDMKNNIVKYSTEFNR